MFRSIRRYFRALGYMVTGRIDAARKELSRDPRVVQATYDNVIEEKTKRIQQYKDAVARMIAQEETKVAKVKSLTQDMQRLEQLKEGAAAKARTLVAERKAQGQNIEQIKQDPEYVKCMTAFNDFSSTLQEKSDHITELESDLGQISASVKNHKTQLTTLMREIEKLKVEANEAVADMITSKEEEEIADMISGVSDERTARELQDLRDLRQQQKAQARVAREMAGTDTRSQEAEFLEYARTSSASDEFDKLIGLAGETDTAAAAEHEEAPARETKLPES